MNAYKAAKSLRNPGHGAKRNSNPVKRRKPKPAKIAKHTLSTPNLAIRRQENVSLPPIYSERYNSMTEMTTILMDQVLTMPRRLVELVLTTMLGPSMTSQKDTEKSARNWSSSSPKICNKSCGDTKVETNQQSSSAVTYRSPNSLSTENSWFFSVLEQAWEQICKLFVSLGIASAHVLNTAWRIWSEKINRLLNEIWDREESGHMIGFEFMDLLQMCLIFLHNYLNHYEKQDKCVYKM